MKYLGEIAIFILMAVVIGGFVVMGNYDPNAIEQEASVVELTEQNQLRDDFQDSLDLENANRYDMYVRYFVKGIKATRPKTVVLPNPYAYGNIIYKLVSRCRDSIYTDYGDKQKILMFKCKRYRQLLSVRNFENCKGAVIRRDIDEINKKSCK